MALYAASVAVSCAHCCIAGLPLHNLRMVCAGPAAYYMSITYALQPRPLPSLFSCLAVLPPSADAPRSQHAGLAAALPLLLAALHRCGSLQTLQLELPPTHGNVDAARLEEVWQRAWQHMLPALRGLLESSAPLRTLRLLMPACLHSASAAYLPQLQAAAAAAPVAVRSQVLLALHPRVGRCSLLQLLPLQVVREVLDLAAPLEPCAIHMAAPPGQ